MSARGRDADLYLYDDDQSVAKPQVSGVPESDSVPAQIPQSESVPFEEPSTSAAVALTEGSEYEQQPVTQSEPAHTGLVSSPSSLVSSPSGRLGPPPPRTQPPASRPQTQPEHHAEETAQADVESPATTPPKSPTPVTEEPAAHSYKSAMVLPKIPIVNGKRDYSKSYAQLAQPDKVFDSNVTICYQNVSSKVSVPKHNRVEHLLTPLVDLWDAAFTCGQSCEKKDLYRIKDVSGIIRPSTMTLVLSPPGEGKSTYLSALANRIPLSAGKVVYNGRNYDQAIKEGCDLRTMTQMVSQQSNHLPLLTVHETLDFAHQMTSVHYDPQRVEDIISLLGLEECRDTIVGDAMIRGISGGQKQRVTTGELLVSDASVLFLDEYSNGLDSSTAEDIGQGLRRFCQKYNASIVATLQQPTPELFALFDRIVVLREGCVVFDGPIGDVLPYFEAMGFHCPGDVDAADFLIDCLTQPRSVILRQKEEELYAAKKAGKKKNIPSTTKKQKNIVQTEYGPIPVSPTPCVTTEEMMDFYHTTPQWKEIKDELDANIGSHDGQTTQELSQEEKDKFGPLMPTLEAENMYKLGYRLPLTTMMKHVTARQFKVFTRNTSTVIPRLFMATFMSILYGLLYWRISDEDYVLRLASMVIAVSQVCFGAFIEIPGSVASSRVVKKQMAARFYASWTYVIATLICAIPMSIAEALIYSVILYWMTNCYPGVEFLVFYCILVGASLMLSCWFRFLAAIGGDEQTSQSMAGPSTGLFTVFGGLFIARSSIPKWMIWLYWISPFSWLCRALVNNEFLSSRYDAIVITSEGNQRIGTMYLKTVDMFVGREWIGYCFIYLIAMTCFICIANSFFLRTRYYEETIGTRRSDEAEIVEGDLDEVLPVDATLDEDLLKQQVQAAAFQQADIQREASKTTGGSTMVTSQMASGTANGSSFNTNALKTLRENLPFTPAWLSFSDLSYTVQVKKDKETVDRILLNHINGYAQPSRMLALMGASGAGKTTLLDVIAGLKNTGKVEGSIKINGQPATKELIANCCGYVEQFDTLFPFSTVYETLLFAARLRLPRAISDDIKKRIVEEIIEILDLGSIKDFIIGNAKIQGLSPSQCKRVNIGVELVANPSIIFLDEPTTGLDSKSAMTVCKVIKRIARSGRSIICTIHQPSAELFFLFDRLLLLGAGGYQIYHGDLGRRGTDFVKYLSRCPGVTPIKPRVNPSSWMLVELGVGVASAKGEGEEEHVVEAKEGQVVITDEPEWADLSPAQRTVQKFRKMYLMSDEYQLTMKRISILESIEVIDTNDKVAMENHRQQVELEQMKTLKKSNIVESDASPDASQTKLPTTTVTIVPAEREGMINQFKYLYARNFMCYWRNPSFVYARYFVVTLLSIIFGLIYFNLKIKDLSSITSYIGACFMGTIFSAITHCSTALPTLMSLRPTFYREKAAGYYRPLFWALCQLSIELFPFIPVGVLVTQIPVYFLVGMDNNAGIFFQYSLATYLLIAMYVAVALTLSAISPSIAAASVLQGAYMSFQSAVSGIAITWPSLPRGFRWLYRGLPGSHLFQAIIMPQFKNMKGDITFPQGADLITKSIRQFTADYLGWGYGAYWQSLGWALLFFVCLQIIAFTATTFLSFNKR